MTRTPLTIACCATLALTLAATAAAPPPRSKKTPPTPRRLGISPNDHPRRRKKNLRIWIEVGANDLNNQFGDWRVANNTLAEVLAAKGYQYQYLWAESAAHVEAGVDPGARAR